MNRFEGLHAYQQQTEYTAPKAGLSLTTNPSCFSFSDSSALLRKPTTCILKARARRAHAWPISP
eukprot:scaffold163430_cov18-Tisochrysis_lutea.AAC.1